MSSQKSLANPRALDHLVLPVGSLAAARARLGSLGFTVAPDALHPFGTENACIFFRDGTYLEPLGVASRETCEAHALAGNVFVARDRAFRFRCGEDGLSAIVLKSADAAADHERFRKAGLSGGEPLEFSRPFKLADGTSAEASFRLAFAADLRAPYSSPSSARIEPRRDIASSSRAGNRSDWAPSASIAIERADQPAARSMAAASVAPHESSPREPRIEGRSSVTHSLS